MSRGKKAKVKFAIRQAVVESYGNAGFTTTAAKMLKLFNKKIDSIYKQ